MAEDEASAAVVLDGVDVDEVVGVEVITIVEPETRAGAVAATALVDASGLKRREPVVAASPDAVVPVFARPGILVVSSRRRWCLGTICMGGRGWKRQDGKGVG